MESTKSMYNPDAVAVKAFIPEVVLNAQYPSSFFGEDPEKPSLHLTNTIETPLEAHRILSKALKDGKADVPSYCEAIYVLIKDIKGTLREDWGSFKLEFGKKDQEVSPVCLVKLMRNAQHTKGTGAVSAVTLSDLVGILILSLAPYRLSRTPEAGREAVRQRIHTQAKIDESEANNVNLDGLAHSHALVQDKTYCVLVAMIDMFLNHFPQHEYGPVRISTIPSKYKDCVALTSYHHIFKVLGLRDPAEILDWVYVDSVGIELMKLLKEGQEGHLGESYFPYQVDFGLVAKSFYSSVMNPTLFLFLHFVGALLGSLRSINARKTTDQNVVNVLTNAKFMAFAFRSHIGLGKYFVEHTEQRILFSDAVSEGQATSDEESSCMRTTSGSAWFMYLAKNGFKEPVGMKHFLKTRKEALQNSRADTIGKYLYEML